MPDSIPAEFRDLFDRPVLASVATVMPDGSPQVTPVWCDYDGTHVLLNTAKGRQKDQNIRRDPRIALSILDPENPYRYLEIRGRVVEITEQGADAHINKLAKRYLNVDEYPYRQPGEVRLLLRVQPDRVRTYGQ